MEFFGLTNYGSSIPIKFLMRPDYKEPLIPPDIKDIVIKGHPTKTFQEAIRELELHCGFMDGYSYRSAKRIRIHRQKGFYKSVGPADMYRSPATAAMDYGWMLTDPDLQNASWFKPDSFHPLPISDDTKLVNRALITDKTAIVI